LNVFFALWGKGTGSGNGAAAGSSPAGGILFAPAKLGIRSRLEPGADWDPS
jgi:hypothetical protein